MFEELNKKSPASIMSSNALPEFRSKSQALLFSLMYYRHDHINPDSQFVRAMDLYRLILEQIPSLKETEILITPKSMVEDTKEIVDHIFNKTDKGLERFKKEVFGSQFSRATLVDLSNQLREAEGEKDPRYKVCCDTGMPEDKCEPDTEPEPENVCQGHPCGKQECEECDEVPEDRRPGYEHERETEESPNSGSDV